MKKYVLPILASIGVLSGVYAYAEQNPAFLTVTTPTIYTETMTDVAKNHGLEKYFNHNPEDGEAVQIGIKYNNGYVLTINVLEDLEGYNRTTFMNNTISSSKIPKSISLKLSEEEGVALLNDFYKKALDSGSIGDAYLILHLRLKALERQLSEKAPSSLVEEVQSLQSAFKSLEETLQQYQQYQQNNKVNEALLREINNLHLKQSTLEEGLRKTYHFCNGRLNAVDSSLRESNYSLNTANYLIEEQEKRMKGLEEEVEDLQQQLAEANLKLSQQQNSTDLNALRAKLAEQNEKIKELEKTRIVSVYGLYLGVLAGVLAVIALSKNNKS